MANNSDIGFDFSKAVPNKFLNPDGSISTLQEIIQEGGGGTPNLQSKDVTITENGTTTVTADEGYDGLSNVDVTVNVDTGENNTKINTGFTNTYNNVAKNILNLPTLDFSDMTRASDTFRDCTKLTSVSIINTYRITAMNGMFQNCKMLETIPLMDTSKVNTMSSMFSGCNNLTSIPQFDTSNVTTMNSMFSQCTNLTTVPLLNTSKVTAMSSMFSDCTNLTTVPLLNTSKVTAMNSMFSGCSSLTSDSLNNILAMCTNATSYTGTKTLKQLGLSQTQATTCQTLSNWDAFEAAGWTTGY